MGFYIQGPARGKAEYLVSEHGGEIVTEAVARQNLADGQGVVCVVDNGPFEAAAFAYSPKEFEEFADTSRDNRPRKWVVMDRKKAADLADYTG